MGKPGKVRKLEKVQKKVLSSSGTNVQVGSGWKPVMIGLWYVDTFCAVAVRNAMPPSALRKRILDQAEGFAHLVAAQAYYAAV